MSIAASTENYSTEQIAAWLRGLVTLAWADGDFSETEKSVIQELVSSNISPDIQDTLQDPISPEELATALGPKSDLGEDFLRTAVMVCLADGVYSIAEDELLEKFRVALQLEISALDSLRHTLVDGEATERPAGLTPPSQPSGVDVLAPVRSWLDDVQVKDPRIAHFLCKMIPSQCPFERDVVLFGHKVVHIPPLCKLNPLYEQLVGLRFRSLSYLADECDEDVSEYC